MDESKYGKYIITGLKQRVVLPSFRHGQVVEDIKPGEKRMINHVIWMDSTQVPDSPFYTECVWFRTFNDATPEELELLTVLPPLPAHTHPFEEIVTFFGSNPDDPEDLGGEVEFWLEDEQFILTKSFLAYVPAGMKHCPLKMRRVDRPMFHFTFGPGLNYAAQ
jgi:hypothetical protein